MACQYCGSEKVMRHGKDRNGNQRFRCVDCKKTWIDAPFKPLGSMRLPLKDAVQALKLLLDGMSIRAVERFTGICRKTLCDLIVTAGEQCQKLLSVKLRNVPVQDVQADEIWSFVFAKQKTCDRLHFGPERGDCYTFISMERGTKLIVNYRVGKRDIDNTREFVHDMSQTVTGQFQISTDGWPSYARYIPESFSAQQCAFGVIQKDYRNMDRVCTSHIERGNLSVRMTLRRWTRLTNAHSKSWRHHEAAMALYVAFYNFVRKHETIKTTPAVAHGIVGKPWTMEDLLIASAAA